MASLSKCDSKSNNQIEIKNNLFEENDSIEGDDFVIVTDKDIEPRRGCEILPTKNEIDISENIKSGDNNNAENSIAKTEMDVSENPHDSENVDDQILKIEKEFDEWIKLRRDTVSRLRDIAEYIGRYAVVLYIEINILPF